MADDSQDKTRTGGDGTDPDSGAAPMKRLGDFELLSELGRGGMGVVYEARQISLNRRVALKVLPPGLGLTGEAVKRFHREAQAAAKLHHTNIVPVHAIGEEEGCHYYAMELIEGQALSEVLKDLTGSGSNPLLDATVTRMAGSEDHQAPASDPAVSSPSLGTSGITSISDTSASSRKWFDAVAKLVSEVADALDYAHGRGVIHRDIKPANLMLSGDGRLCITDFGLARVAQEPGMTVSGSLMGTPAYMSPEQVASGRMKLDHRTDVYSLGAVLYELLTHQRPFPGESREEILGGILTKDPRPPRRFNPRIPVDLETICQKAMEKDPDKRYATAGEFAEDLRRYLAHGLIQARRAGILKRTWKSIRRHPVASTITVGILLLTALGIFAGKAWIGMQAADTDLILSEARQQLTRGELREAMGRIERILASDPKNIEAIMIRARIHMQLYHFVDCVADARLVLQNDPENWEAHALIAAAAGWGTLHSIPVDEHRRIAESKAPDTADAAFLRGLLAQYTWGQEQERGDSREAIRWLTEVIDNNPGHALALEARSDAYSSLKDFPSALADAERLITALPGGAKGYYQKGYISLQMRDLDGALRAADRAIEIDPESNLGYSLMADIQRVRANRSRTIEALSRAIEVDPRCSGELSERGNEFQWSGRYDDAVIDFERCIEINPDAQDCYEGLFWAHWNAGRREEALDVIEITETRGEQWLSMRGKTGPPYLRMLYYQEIGDFERALQESDRIIELLPQKIDAYMVGMQTRLRMKGQAGVDEICDLAASIEIDIPGELLKRANMMRDDCGREDVALADYEAIIEMAPSWAEPLRMRSWLHMSRKQYQEANDDITRAIELAPTWVESYFTRGQNYEQMGRFEDALADYEYCVEMGATGGNLKHAQARVLVRLGRDEDALRAMRSFLEQSPHSDLGWRTYAILLWNMGRVKEAIEAFDHILEINPGDETNKAIRAYFNVFESGDCDEGAIAAEEYASRVSGQLETWSRIAVFHCVGFYYLCPEHYDPKRALELAEKAAEANNRQSFWQQNYAVALYRNGRYEEALAVLKHVHDLVAQVDTDQLFWTSMTHARLGLMNEARNYYDRAVERMEEERARHPGIKMIRAEAAELLGIAQ